MNNLNLCKDHKQEWKQSEYAKENCDYCKLLEEIEKLKITIMDLRWKLANG